MQSWALGQEWQLEEAVCYSGCSQWENQEDIWMHQLFLPTLGLYNIFDTNGKTATIQDKHQAIHLLWFPHTFFNRSLQAVISDSGGCDSDCSLLTQLLIQQSCCCCHVEWVMPGGSVGAGCRVWCVCVCVCVMCVWCVSVWVNRMKQNNSCSCQEKYFWNINISP